MERDPNCTCGAKPHDAGFGAVSFSHTRSCGVTEKLYGPATLSEDVRLAPGASHKTHWTSNINVRFPAFWLELDHRSRVTLESIDIDNQEQLVDSARGTPAILFALEEVTQIDLPTMRFGTSRMRLTFKNPPDAPEAVFRVWCGEWIDVQDRAAERGTGAP